MIPLQDKILEILPKEKESWDYDPDVISHNSLLLEIKALIPKIIEIVKEDESQRPH